MKVEQIYTGCLAHGAYYIQSGNEAVIIDPLRETAPYIEKAAQDGVKIKYVLETHFHADFVSGHLDLARETGATIVFGPNAKPSFDAYIAADGEELIIGNAVIKVLHTPGHTMESTTFLLKDETGKDYAIFTGDTLFIGDVGRPDLAVKTDLTREDLAGHLYDSLMNKIMPLSDEVIVYPGHGAGSACGKNMSKETFATLGNQKIHNYALQPMTKEEFSKEVTTGLVTPPAYFPMNVKLNKEGYQSFESIKGRGLTKLSAEAFELLAEENHAVVIDTRTAADFAKGFVPGSINIGIDGSFAPWAGALFPDAKQAILIVADEGQEEEVITRLSRVGLDQILGYLNNGIKAWKAAEKEVDMVEQIDAETLHQLQQKENIHILDVRKNSEYLSEHLDGAENLPLDNINSNFIKINASEKHYVHCAGGYRSMIYISILKARGYHNLVDVKEGFKAIKDLGKFNVSEYVCPSTLL
ncbi:MAG: MBL fold metallo-hydrolase [Bacteroidetes bacterium]|nr:MBL fold metallo-hydrolase [Bacteroidota bacterium]